MRRKSLVMAVVLIVATACACHAQTYEDWSVAQTSSTKSFSMGAQLGLPYVLGVDVATHFSSKMSAGLGFGFVPDLITFGGQLRLSFLEPGANKTVPIVGAGINQYWIDDNGRNTEPVAINFVGGVEHFFGSNTSLGIYIGYIKTISKSEDNRVKVWGVNDDLSTLCLGLTGRYYF